MDKDNLEGLLFDLPLHLLVLGFAHRNLHNLVNGAVCALGKVIVAVVTKHPGDTSPLPLDFRSRLCREPIVVEAIKDVLGDSLGLWCRKLHQALGSIVELARQLSRGLRIEVAFEGAVVDARRKEAPSRAAPSEVKYTLDRFSSPSSHVKSVIDFEFAEEGVVLLAMVGVETSWTSGVEAVRIENEIVFFEEKDPLAVFSPFEAGVVHVVRQHAAAYTGPDDDDILFVARWLVCSLLRIKCEEVALEGLGADRLDWKVWR